MIGDPSGKNTERTLLQPEQLQHNARGISENLNHFLKSTSPVESQTNQPLLLNNIDWHGKMSAIDFLRDIGKYFRVGVMLSKDSVKNRLEGDGLSFTEFSYQLLQGSDFHHLYTHHDCKVQLGGSDQWGNITAGCDLVRKKCGAEVFGVTVPLLTTASGEKFGKVSTFIFAMTRQTIGMNFVVDSLLVMPSGSPLTRRRHITSINTFSTPQMLSCPDYCDCSHSCRLLILMHCVSSTR
jgi:tyrosyl-tRNA synthetase